ncbi:MAG: cytochrome c [Chloroflexi bacterium]|nr:cytochrome c [Chloroflexota bacterium]
MFYWIQNGITGSAMPAFKAALSGDDLWHLVNYVRRLSAQTKSTKP